MATKLKSMSKRRRAGFLFYLIAAAALAFHEGIRIFRAWHDVIPALRTKNMRLIYVIGGLIFFGLLCYYIYHLGPKTWKNIETFRADRIWLEVLLVILAVLWGTWAKEMPKALDWRETFLGLSTHGRWDILFVTIFVFFPAAVVFTGCIALLLRRVLMERVKETSIIWITVRNYKEDLPFIKKIRVESRIRILLATMCPLITLLLVFERAGVGRIDLVTGVVIIIVSFVAYAIFLKNSVIRRIDRDMGQLVEQIHAMAEGTLEAPCIENEESALYESSQELHDISGNLQYILKKQMQSERMKVDLITNVSHDLKTPLTSMIGYIDLLKKEELSPEARDYVEVLAVKHEQLKEMIQDIFELSKSTSGEVQLELEELNMKKLLEQTLADMEDAITEAGREIRKNDFPENLYLIGDGKKLYRVFQNLIENALKYSLKGTRIFIEAKKEAGKIYVVIKNTAAYEMNFTADEILERFSRGDKSRNTKGHGLGLAIAQSFTRNMGGELKAEIDGDQFRVTVIFDSTVRERPLPDAAE